MAFYQESIDLGLKKNFNQFQYDEIQDELHQQQIYSLPEQQLTQMQEGKQILLEKTILYKDIQNLCAYFIQNEVKKDFPFEKIKNRVCHILEKYQEQSSLLDSILETVVAPIMSVIKYYVHQIVQTHIKDPTQQFIASNEFYALTDTLYIASKVSGVRSISRFFPHEVKDIEPVVYFLQQTQGTQHWEARYVMILWLSVIILAPFDLATIDSNLFKQVGQHLTNQQYSGSIVLCLVNLGIGYLNSSTKVRNASALFLSKLLSRPDVLKMGLLGDFFDWAIQKANQLYNDIGSAFYVTGILEAVVEVLKIVQRDQIQPHLIKIVQGLQLTGTSATINLFLAKLTQRAGLVYLRPRVVAWTYKKGNRNLASTQVDHSKIITNVVVQKINQIKETEDLLKIEAEDYFADVDQEALEIIIDNLLVMLTNKDTIVRWSAAKGIGRICGRLELDQANDVLNNLIEVCFNPIQSDTAWHGGCLALGELCRRGLILDNRLPLIIPIICRALIFEQNQGGYSTGTNVRDSACYIAWSAARAYDPQALVPYIDELSKQLAVVMIFDREVNVRRAASSTFQELVGRCPNIIPHGISILSECDYFSLALRHNAYLKISPYVASFPEYYNHMVNHLAFIKVQSQDKEVRKLTAKALARLIQIKPAYFFENDIIQGLLNLLKINNFNARHGALFAIGDILVGLTGKIQGSWDEKELKDSVFLRTLTQNEKQLTKAGEYLNQFKEKYKQLLKEDNLFMVPPEIIQQILEVPFYIEQEKLLRGKVGEQLRIAICRYLECISIARLEISPKQYKFYLVNGELIDEGLKNPLEEIQNAAVRALTNLSRNYDEGEYLQDGQIFLKKILEQLKGKTTYTSGYTQAIGAFSANVVYCCAEQIVNCLSHLGISKKSTPYSVISLDPDARKYAVKSLAESMSVMIQNFPVPQELLKQALRSLLRSFGDYTMNKRGDVGLYIRENAIVGIEKVLQSFIKNNQINNYTLEKELMEEIIGNLLQQVNEKIDRVRLLAGSVLQDLIKNVIPKLVEFDNRDILQQVFSTENLQKALLEDQEKVDQTFQQDVIEAEIKNLKERLLHMSKTELVYHWNLPHCCFRLIVPLLKLKNFTYYIIKGLCISVGGISESIQKCSEEALSKYIMENQDSLEHLMDQILLLLTTHQKDDRLIIPLFKTISVILEKDEFQQWDKIEHYTTLLYHATIKEIDSSESINKISASVPIILDVLHLNNNLVKEALQRVKDLLLHVFPKIRKQTADKLYLVLLSLDCEEVISAENSMALQDFLLETDWLFEKLDLNECRKQLETFLT